MPTETIFIVEDDPSVAAFVQTILEREGFKTDVIANGSLVMERVRARMPDLILLDIMLPGIDGLQVCAEIRKLGTYVPVIMLTAKDDLVDKVVGLEIGADDYITKPFKSRELTARVRAILRLANHRPAAADSKLVIGLLEIDPCGRTVTVAGQVINLTPKEFDLLQLLAANPGRAFGREMLLERIWGYEYLGESRTVDVHIQRLRRKIEIDPSNPHYLLTVRNFGYKFVK